MKFSSVVAVIKSTLKSASLGGAIVCVTCVFAVLCANELRLHASQWTPPDPVPAASVATNNFDTHMDLETTRKLLISGHPPELGSSKAPVTIVEFADFECGHCRKMSDVLEKQLLPAEKDKVRIIYRYFPLPQHNWAKPAAQMAACVQSQSREQFWKLHDFLYADQDSFSAANIRPEIEDFLAKQGKLNTKAFESCIDSKANDGQVESDMQMARTLGIHETPALFANGVRLHDVHELQQLEDVVASALKDQTAAQINR